jgi:hypothetical protein
MPQQPENPTPDQRVERAAKWAERQRFWNVAADLRQALADLEQQQKRQQ